MYDNNYGILGACNYEEREGGREGERERGEKIKRLFISDIGNHYLFILFKFLGNLSLFVLFVLKRKQAIVTSYSFCLLSFQCLISNMSV